jgi:hypothetical protein
LYIRVGDSVRAQVININKHAKQSGKVNRRGNAAEFISLARAFPLVVLDSFDNTLPFFKMSVMFKFISSLPGSVRMQEKEAFYCLL